MSTVTYKSELLPGQRINILSGMSASNSVVFNQKLSPGNHELVDQLVAGLDPGSCYFGPFPILVPCDNWSKLVNALFCKYTFNGRPDSFAAAAALQAHSSQSGTIQKSLAAKLGIKSEDVDDNADRGFILARVPRIVPNGNISLTSAGNASIWGALLAECASSIQQLQTILQKIDDVNMATSSAALQAILATIEKETGSHIVESITIGDEVIQIFVYNKKQYKVVCNAMDNSGWDDAQSLGFRYFTSSSFLLYATTPFLASNDDMFASVLPLLEDKNYGLKASIFNLIINSDAQHKAIAINSLTCIGANSMSVTTPATVARNLAPSVSYPGPVPNTASVALLLDTVSVQCAITRFGTDKCGSAAVPGDLSVSYRSLYNSFNAAVPVTMFWSPYVSLVQPYVDLGALWNSSNVDKSAVKNLIVVADVVELLDSVDLSTLNSFTLVCRLLVSGANGVVPTVKLSSTAWSPLQLYCGSMSGTCAFQAAGDPASHRVVYDINALSLKPDSSEVVYEDFFSGRFPAQPFISTSTASEALWRKASLQAGIESLLMMVNAALRPQAILSPELNKTAVEAWKCLQWVNSYLKDIVGSFTASNKSVPEDIASLYSHAVTLLRTVIDPRTPVSKIVPQVPSLRFTAYQDATNKLLDLAGTYADQITDANQKLTEYSIQLNNQFKEDQRDDLIRKMGQFMVDQNKAFAAHENDIVTSHNDIINKNNETILVLSQRETQIKSQYSEYLTKLEESKKALKDAIEEKKREMEAKMVVDFAFSLVEVFSGVMTGVYGFKVAGEAEGVEKTLKKWESFLKLAETTNKLIESSEKLAENISQISDLSNSTPGSFTEPPTDTDWDIFMNDSEAQVRPAEEFVKPEVENFIATVRNLTVVAKSMNVVTGQISQLQFNNFVEVSSKNVAKQQMDRLSALQLNLQKPSASPTIDYIADLGQYTAMLQQKQNNVLNKLAEIAMLQDDSMTYYYLSKPAFINKFDLASIKDVLTAQAINAVRMLSSYPYPPSDAQQPIVVTADCVSVDDLTSEDGVSIDISPTFGLFYSMARVRINSVDVRVDGVSTDKGQCHVRMLSGGVPMFDRGLARETLTYNMISREWHVVYDIASDKTIIGTQPSKEWDEYFTKPTPFQNWKVSLPKTPENAGLVFKSPTTKITLSFNVEMMYSPAPAKKTIAVSRGLMLTAANAAPDPTAFLSLLKGCSVTDGWDVVSFVSVDRINDLWNQRWKAESEASFKGDPMFVQVIDITHSQSLPGNIRVDYHLQSKAGAPCLTFVADANQSALVGIPLIDGSLTTTTYLDGQKAGEKTVSIQSTSSLPVMVKTKAALQALPGDVDSFHAVHIDPASGVFAFENIDLDPQVDAGFCTEICEYFKKQQLPPWLVGSLRFTADKDYLIPKSFFFQTFTPPDTHRHDWPSILGIYVLTTTPKAPAHGMRLSWPDAAWPVSPDFDATVFFSADLLWNNEVIPAMHASLADATVVINPTTHEYSASFAGSIVVCDQPVQLYEGWEDENERVVNPPPHAKVSFPNSALSLKFNLSSLELSSNANWTEQFPYQGRTPCPGAGVSLDVAWDNVRVTCTFDAVSYPHIDTNNFNVAFDTISISPTVNIDYDIHKFLGIPILAQIQPGIVANSKTALTNKFSGLTIKLDAMSMFAVSNLLFPESKALNPSGVYFPGDMVIVGQVTRTWVKL